MKKILFNILKFGLLGVACIFFGFSVYNCSARNVSGDRLAMPFGYGFAIVVTGSMEPTISIDDLIIVKEFDEYKVDDMVVFHQDGLLIVHRVISIDEENKMITTQGDANNTADDPIPFKSIKGKVVNVVENAGGLIRFLKSPIVTVTIIVCALLLMEYSFRKEKQEKKDKINKLKEEIRALQQK